MNIFTTNIRNKSVLIPLLVDPNLESQNALPKIQDAVSTMSKFAMFE